MEHAQIDMYAGIDAKCNLGVSHEILEIITECTECGITNFIKVEKLTAMKDFYFLEKIKTIIEIGPLGYEFIVKRNGRTKPNIKIDGKRAQTILNYWTNIILKLYRDNDMEEEIGVGLTFSECSVAELVKLDGKNYFLVNPNHIGKTGGTIELGIELFMSAAHEFSHLYYVEHNEHFSSRLGAILKELSFKWSEWQDLFILSKREVLSAFE